MLEIEIAGVRFRNPVILASGTIGTDYAGLVDWRDYGAVVAKSVTLSARIGNPPPRVCETPAGMLNAIGLENKGVNHFVRADLPAYLEAGATVIASIAGETVEEYADVAEVLNEAKGVVALEVNVSCPNVSRGGVQFGSRPRLAAEVTAAVKAVTAKPVFVKLTPNVTSITDAAKAVEAAGADAVSLINTITGMVIDIATEKPVLGKKTGGLSGPAIRPVAVRMVYEVAGAVSVPIIGVGGIMTAEDAAQFLMAGATAVEVGTAVFVDPKATGAIASGLASIAAKKGYDHVSRMIGKARQ